MATVTEIIDDVLNLPDVDRSYLASKLLESLEDGNISSEWSEEIANRVQSIDAGTAHLIPHAEVMEEARRAIRG